MNVAIFGGFDKKPFPPGWTKETVVAVLGGGDLDLTSASPGPEARLTAVAILGGIKIVVSPGTRVSTSGFGLFGGRSVVVEPGDGPEMGMRLIAVFGGIEVKEPERPGSS